MRWKCLLLLPALSKSVDFTRPEDINNQDNVDKVDFTRPEDVTNQDNVVTLGLTLINIKNQTSTWALFSEDLVTMIHSLLYYSPDTNINFVVITDENTKYGMQPKHFKLENNSVIKDFIYSQDRVKYFIEFTFV